LPPLPSQKDDERLFKQLQLKDPRQSKKEPSPGQSAASSDHDSSQHESGSGSSSDDSPIMVQKSQYHALMAEVQKLGHNMDKCDLSTGSHKNFSKTSYHLPTAPPDYHAFPVTVTQVPPGPDFPNGGFGSTGKNVYLQML
jgi:hypothetical protein